MTEMRAYIDEYKLTCDPGWTLDFAEELVAQASVSFPLEPPSRSQLEDVQQTWRAIEPVPFETGSGQHWPLVQDFWLFPKERLSYAKRFRDSIHEYTDTEVVDLHWWDDGSFEPQLDPISGDFLLQRQTIDRKSGIDLGEFGEIRREIGLVGQQTYLQALLQDEPVRIPQPEFLADTTLRLTPSQYQTMREHKVQRAELRASLVLNSDILTDENQSNLPLHRTISPPLTSRISSSFAQSCSRNRQELVSSVIHSFELEKIHEGSPSPSNDTWNTIDPCQHLPFTPPTSSLPSEINEDPGICVNVLTPSSLSEDGRGVEELRNPFEKVLFSRTEGISLHPDRSKSFNPRNHLDVTSFLFRSHKFEGGALTPEPTSNLNLIATSNSSIKDENEISFNILKDLTANKECDDQRFEHEIFGSPGDAINPQSILKKIPINVPDLPLGNRVINEELIPFNDFMGLQEADKPWLRRWLNTSQDLKKVEGLRALNIELPWNPYSFQPSKTIEKLTNLELEPDGSVSENSVSEQVCSLVSKRNKTLHNYCVTEEWPKKSDLLSLDQTSNGSDSRYSPSGVATLCRENTPKVVSPSIYHSPKFSEGNSKTGTTLTPAPENESFEETPAIASLDEIDKNYQTPLHTTLTDELKSNPSYHERRFSFLEDDEAINLLHRKASPSLSDSQINDFYSIWTLSESD